MDVYLNAVYPAEDVSGLSAESKPVTSQSSISHMGMAIPTTILGGTSPFKPFSPKFLSTLVASLTILQLLIGYSSTYITVIGFLGLGIEATLPIPQFLSNYRHKSVSGFRASVIIAWLLGDIFKCSYFFFGNANVTWQFKACAIVQISFDLGIATQFFVYGNKQSWLVDGVGVSGKQVEELEEGVFVGR